MDFAVFKDRLVAAGYSDDTAYAKIAHDIVLKAVQDSGFHDNLTVKGGVVMSAITGRLRRVFGNKTFMRNLSRPVNAWLDVAPEEVTSEIIAFISSLEWKMP